MRKGRPDLAGRREGGMNHRLPESRVITLPFLMKLALPEEGRALKGM